LGGGGVELRRVGAGRGGARARRGRGAPGGGEAGGSGGAPGPEPAEAAEPPADDSEGEAGGDEQVSLDADESTAASPPA